MFRDLCASVWDSCCGLGFMIPFALSWFGGGRHSASADWAGAFQFGATDERQTGLDSLGALIDWSTDQVMASLYPFAAGEKAWPPLAMFKALLLATWYDLSDVALAAALSEQRALLCARARLSMRP